MTKLKCVDHNRRIVTVPLRNHSDINAVRHRNDGTPCHSDVVTIGGFVLSAHDITSDFIAHIRSLERNR